MPKMVLLEINPDYATKLETSERKAFRAEKPVKCDYVTALENIKKSGGRYRIQPPAKQKVEVDLDLNELSNQELGVMMIKLGVKTEKKMKREDVIQLIEKKLSEIEIVDDEE